MVEAKRDLHLVAKAHPADFLALSREEIFQGLRGFRKEVERDEGAEFVRTVSDQDPGFIQGIRVRAGDVQQPLDFWNGALLARYVLDNAGLRAVSEEDLQRLKEDQMQMRGLPRPESYAGENDDLMLLARSFYLAVMQGFLYGYELMRVQTWTEEREIKPIGFGVKVRETARRLARVPREVLEGGFG